jgi:hypothetical protein
MPRGKDVSAIAIVVALAAGADAVFDGVGTSATPRDAVVDGRLIRCDIAREKCGAFTPVTHFACLEPEGRSSRKLIVSSVFHWDSLSSKYRVKCTEMPNLGDWAEGRFLSSSNRLRMKEDSSLIFARRINGH